MHVMGSGGPGKTRRQTQRLADRLRRQDRHRDRHRPSPRQRAGRARADPQELRSATAASAGTCSRPARRPTSSPTRRTARPTSTPATARVPTTLGEGDRAEAHRLEGRPAVRRRRRPCQGSARRTSDKYYPGATEYEVAGFFWWQGDKDRYNAGHAAKYEKNLVNLIAALRKDFNAPNAKFVCATLGQTEQGERRGQ